MSDHDGHGGVHDSGHSEGHGHSGSGHGASADSRQVAVFILILAIVAVAVIAILASGLPLQITLAALLVLAAVVLVHPNIAQFREYERGVLFRFGKFQNVVGPGWVLYFSGIDTFVRVDLRTQILDIHPQEVITQDNVKIKIDAIIYYKVVDAKKSVIEIKDVVESIGHLLKAQLRTVTGRMLLEEILEKTEEINTNLFNVIKEVESKWGLVALRVEISSIELPQGLQIAMEKRREAGEYKEKMETEARAKGLSIEILDKSLRGMSDKTVAYLYLDVLKRVAEGKSTKIIFPLELSRLVNLISEKSGWKKGEYDDIAKTLVQAYQQEQKQALEKTGEKPEEKKVKDKKIR
ncbi:TPA: hypothetical protein HA244_02255 [Candidatus Micrarchaeota archaeon]|nr:hypothetical protein [Candidatus Micrarchaeota archaeon]